MARWIALLLAGCAEPIAVEVKPPPTLVEEPVTVEECPIAAPGPTFSPAGEPPCVSEGRRCFYGALTCMCRRRDRFARWGCAPDECFARDGSCAPGTRCDFGFEDTRLCNGRGYWISVARRP